jgi:hypothetical protein
MTNVKLGTAEPKKVATLGGLLLVLLVVWWFNSSDDPGSGPGTATAPSPLKTPKEIGVIAAPPPVARREGMTPVKRAGSRQQLRSNVQDFKPKLFDKDNPVDPTKVDPTLGTQIMARLQGLHLEGGGRSLFDFGSVAAAADVPKGPLIKPAKPKPSYPFVGPRKPEPEVAKVEPPKPPPPPIPLKFYGYEFSPKLGKKRAFFLEGEDIYIAAEGESMKSGKYRLIKIGVNSAVVEDIANKNQQSLPLVEEQQQAGND